MLIKSHERDNRLAELGLESKHLTAAVIAGETARDNCSLLHPKMFGGYSAFAERVKVLRENLIPQGWRSETINGLELVTNDKLAISLAVCTGAITTGLESEPLLSKYPKGLATKKAVSQNQLSFDEKILTLHETAKSVEEFTTWYLMVHREEDVVRYELCLPIGFDDENRISEVKERIIFDEINLSKATTPTTKRSSSGSDDAEEIVVEVSRKT